MPSVLIIEDDQALQQAYRNALSSQGIEVFQATTATEGLELVKTKRPSLVIIDVMLPGGQNGFDVLESLKRDPATKAIPVFVLTNLDSEEKTARDIGAAEYFVKTNVSILNVVEKITGYLKQSRGTLNT